MERTLENLRNTYPFASDEDLYRYMDLRDEGYPAYQARVMCGLCDPDEQDDD